MIVNYIISIIFLPVLLFIGIVTSYEDFKSSKVRNKWVKFGFYYALAALGLLLLWDLVADPVTQYYYTHVAGLGLNDPRPVFTVNSTYFSHVAVNSALVLLVGFFLWRYGMLAAGDAKLIFVFSLLLPLNYYWTSYLPVFPSLALFINIFLPSLVFILSVSVYHSVIIGYKKLKIGLKFDWKDLYAKTKLKLPELGKMFIGFLVILIAMDHFRNFIRPVMAAILPDEGFVFLILFLLYRPFFLLFNKYKKLPYVAILALMVYFVAYFSIDPSAALQKFQRMFTMVVIYVGIFKMISYFLNIYFNNVAEEDVTAGQLAPGMSLAATVECELGSMVGGGLSEEQVITLQKWAEKEKIESVRIYRKFPFAFWIFIGVLITIAIKGSVLKFIL